MMKRIISLWCLIIIILNITACEEFNIIKDENFTSIVKNNFVENENSIEFNTDNFIKHVRKVKTIKEYNTNNTVDDIDTVKFGTYPQDDELGLSKQPIEWIVLEREDNKALLLSKFILEPRKFNNDFIEVNWENSDLRKWLNEDFINHAFTNSEQKQILLSQIENNRILENGIVVDANTNDKVFCLSYNEVEKYFNQNDMKVENKLIATRGTNYAKYDGNTMNRLCVLLCDEWFNGNSRFLLRTSGSESKTSVWVDGDGRLYKVGYFVVLSECGIRPAIWVTY